MPPRFHMTESFVRRSSSSSWPFSVSSGKMLHVYESAGASAGSICSLMACWRPEGSCRPRDLTDAILQQLHKQVYSLGREARIQEARLVDILGRPVLTARGSGCQGKWARVDACCTELRCADDGGVEGAEKWCRANRQASTR